MSITVPHPITVTTTTAAFREGFQQGKQGFYRALTVGNQIKEDDLVAIVRNLTEIAIEAGSPKSFSAVMWVFWREYSPITSACFSPGSDVSHALNTRSMPEMIGLCARSSLAGSHEVELHSRAKDDRFARGVKE